MTMGLIRLFLLALLLGFWASIAGACDDSQMDHASAVANAPAPTLAPCAQMAFQQELPVCECVSSAIAALDTTSGCGDRLVEPESASAVLPAFFGDHVPILGLPGSRSFAAPPSLSVYLITSRLRL